jgi:hypothetical protein
MRFRLAARNLAVICVLGFFAIGLVWAREPIGAPCGLLTGLISASFWAVGALSGPRWNATLNLFAAVFAAGSLGFLAPVDRICSGQEFLLLCR